MSRDIDRMFGIDDDKTIIEISHGGTYIKKTLNEDAVWPDTVKAFFDMLCGCGYVIDQVQAHEIISEIEMKNLESLNNE